MLKLKYNVVLPQGGRLHFDNGIVFTINSN
jgi:hypothetical protein